ncbi:hypothetical protein RHS04_04756 [Rhizoctonia solani]|uniref:Zn(2)-C6 fungal-type domain-containing protein n=1 Tax=Rhizoctonia solani TaxID=456999 RepID=A0A8H7H8T1_9AGAM|nr:hypothetical protein RHS04_04756 [Rhizoctonia solani]
MSTRGKLTPGPVGVSCLTCRRRYVVRGLDLPTRADPRARTSHKKCDLQRPACDRCLKGGYECLGYKHVKSKGYGYDQRLASDHTSPANSSSGLLGSSAPSLSPRSDDGPRRDANLSADITAVSEDLANNVTSAQPGVALVRKDLSNLFSFFNEDAVIYDTFPPTRSQTQVTENEILSPLCSASNQRPIFLTNPLLFQLASPTLKGVPISPDVCGIAEYVVSHFGRILSLTYFSPRDEIEKLRGMAIWRLSTCKFSRQSMLIDAKVQWSVLRGNHLMHASAFTRWIEGFEQAVRTRLGTHLTGYELQERLNDVLEMLLIKSRFLDSATTYGLSCRFVPNFLQMVYSDPTMWSPQYDLTLVSMAHILACSRYGPALYMLMDIVGSMVYGLPHLVDYNTDVELFHPESHPVEWVDCFPGEFMIILAKINTCRDQTSTEDWRTIEQRLFSWKSRPQFEPKVLESWRSVAWTALQETWRQTLLIYLYLAVCGVLTDDPRIQVALKQVFQLIGVIRRQDPPVSNVHLFSQYLIAGICSRTEKQRKLVRARLGCVDETRMWSFRSADIVPVLDHLWLGAGMGGQPVTWNNYVHSRRTALPLPS